MLWVGLLAFLGALITVKDSIVLIIKEIPEYLTADVYIVPKLLKYDDPTQRSTFLMKIRNNRSEPIFDVQVRFLLDKAPFGTVQIRPLSGREAERPCEVQPKVIQINPWIYGLFGQNSKGQNTEYYVFKSFDPGETKTMEVEIWSSEPRHIEATVMTFSKTGRPYRIDQRTHTMAETTNVQHWTYFGVNLNRLVGVGAQDMRYNLSWEQFMGLRCANREWETTLPR